MVLTDNLIAYYDFDSNANDSVGTYNATLNGGTASTGKINGAYRYNNGVITDYCATPTLALGTSYSYNMWVKVNGANLYKLFASVNSTGGQMNLISATTLEYYVNGTNRSGGKAFSRDVWHMVTITNSNGTCKFYIDSVLQWTSGGSTPTAGDTQFSLGTYAFNSIYAVDCDIDEFAVWTRIIDQTEIEELYNSGDGLQYPFSIGWTGTINGLEDPSKVNGIDVADITSINGVE